MSGRIGGNPDRNPDVIRRIKEIQSGSEQAYFTATANPTDKTMAEMFKVFGEGVDITKADPGLRLFFTNYSLGYRAGSETGGMAKRVMRQDAELFDDLVLAVKPKIIICLGRITYEMVAKVNANGFLKKLREGYRSMLHFQRIRLFPFMALLIAVQEGFPTSAERTICEKRGKRLQESIKTCAKEGF